MYKKPKILITSGPTRERIDDARFISNYSSGKMGKCIAQSSIELDFETYIVSGPVAFEYDKCAKVINVESAQEMLESSLSIFPSVDIAICVAAVSDYRLKSPYVGKIKKDDQKNIQFTCELIKNPDILKSISEMSSNHQVVVGFAAESENLERYALDKLFRKKCDMICANYISKGQTFGSEDSKITIYTKNDKANLGLIPKEQSANLIIKKTYELYLEKNQNFQ